MSTPAAALQQTETVATACVVCGCTEHNACIIKARRDGFRPCRWLRERADLHVGLCNAKTCRPYLTAWVRAVAMAKKLGDTANFQDCLKFTIEKAKAPT